MHWVLYNIPANTAAIDPNLPAQGRVPGIGIQGKNDGGKIGYTGPCPPSGVHHYYARLFALDTELGLAPGATKKQVEEAMRGHIIEQAELMGTYSRSSERAA